MNINNLLLGVCNCILIDVVFSFVNFESFPLYCQYIILSIEKKTNFHHEYCGLYSWYHIKSSVIANFLFRINYCLVLIYYSMNKISNWIFMYFMWKFFIFIVFNRFSFIYVVDVNLMFPFYLNNFDSFKIIFLN